MSEKLGIAIVCFPTFGGSGVVATEVALAMAERGHRVHLLARDVPVRLHAALAAQHGGPGPSGAIPATPGAHASRVVFHEVPEADASPLPVNAYPIALAAKLVELATWERIDVVHAHYAAPHATAAWMARDALAHACSRGAGREGAAGGETPPCAPKLVTTLHGTDVTAADASHLAITRHALAQHDALTAPSAFLQKAARDVYGPLDVEVIPNFVDTSRFTPLAHEPSPSPSPSPSAPDAAHEIVVLHVSNFRKVKRIGDVVAVFAKVASRRPARLVLVGDGPERSHAERRLRELGLGDRATFLGKQESFVDVLAAADVFLLPSESESFGLAALEAMSCGVPVVATDTGGLPEVVAHGQSGLLAPVGDVAAMAAHVLTLADANARRSFSRAARQRAVALFQRGPVVDRYEALYRRVVTTEKTR